MADRIGQHLGHYQLIGLLGQGHWAAVYLAEHGHLHTQAAIKVLHGPWTDREVDAFLSEARILARLRHPHIVRVLDFGVQEGTPFLVMEYAPNGTLRQRHPKGTRLPLEAVVSYVKQVAQALQYAHDQRLIHRDLKPENLLLGPEQQVWLADFGLAIVVHSVRSQPLEQAAGTLAYMAPEQLKDQPTAASDQYALGVMVYEWLCGEQPFSGSFPELAVQHTLSLPPSLTKKAPTLPQGVEHVVLKALAKDPSQRFASVQAFALVLEEACRAESSSGQTLLMPSSQAPGASAPAARYNLPVQLTPLIGRDQEVAAVCTLLRRPAVRLVTLTGTGGIGKTRLALQMAAQVSDDFADGVFFVNLAPLSDPALVVPTIAQTLDVKEIGEQLVLDVLKVSLRDKQLLLLLDNFEQVLGAASQVTELLAACPNLKIVVTSRAVLHVRGEQEFAVPPLAVPDPKRLPDLLALAQYEAVALFIARAQAVKPEFQLTNANAPAVAEICTRLDGLPLAIELAAARIKLLPPQALLPRLGQRLGLLTSGVRDVPARQQTLRNTIEWSYQLLHEEEQRLFRRLSVFVGGCTLEAVETICAALDNGAGQVLEGVVSLLDKSLLQQTESEAEEPRLMMLETIREYGLEVLATSREMEAIRQVHALYYLRLSQEAEPQLDGPQQTVWLERLEREHDNLRVALRWLLERGEAEQGTGDGRQMALRLAGALQWFWQVRGHFSEGRTFLEQALTASKEVASPVRAKALFAAAQLAHFQGDDGRAEALLEESLTLYRDLQDMAGVALSLHFLGRVARTKGNLVAARSLFEEALALWKGLGDKKQIAFTLENLALLESRQGEYTRGRALCEESLAIQRELGNKVGISDVLCQLAWIIFVSQGPLATVRSLVGESLVLSRELGDKRGIADWCSLSGHIALSQDDAFTARALAQESLLLSREVGDQQNIAQSLFLLGRTVAVQDDYTAARALFEESLSVAREIGDKLNSTFYLEGLASVVAAQGEPIWAARLWGAAEARRESMGVPIWPVERTAYERTVEGVRAQLGEKAFATAWAQGRSMTLEQVLAAQGAVTMPTTAPAGPSCVPPKSKASTSADGLTAREIEVLRLVAQGLTDAQVAEHLVISPHTVNTHLKAIYSKIGVSSRSAATRYAIEQHLL